MPKLQEVQVSKFRSLKLQKCQVTKLEGHKMRDCSEWLVSVF